MIAEMRVAALYRMRAAALAAASATLICGGAATAQEVRAPVGPIELVLGQAAGSTPDVLMRRIAQILNAQGIVENPIVVQNRTGGAWAVAMEYILERPGDENVIMSIAEPLFATPIVQGTETVYDQLTPFTILAQTQILVLGQPDLPANTLAELADIARQEAHSVAIAGTQAGGTSHQITGLIQSAAGIELNYIPHDGGGAAMAAFLGGNMQIIPSTIEESLPHLEAGTAKPLAILTPERLSAEGLADIPTAREQGIDAVFLSIFGLAGPPDLDPAVKRWWEEKIDQLVENEEWKQSLADNFMGDTYVSGDDLPGYLQRHHEARLQILRSIGLAKL